MKKSFALRKTVAVLLLSIALVSVFSCCSREATESETVTAETVEETVTKVYHYGSNIFYNDDKTIFRRNSTTDEEEVLYRFDDGLDQMIYNEETFWCLSGGCFYIGSYDGDVRVIYDTSDNKPALTRFQGSMEGFNYSGPWLWFSTDDVVNPYVEINITDGSYHYMKDPHSDSYAFQY